jgi:hypothetical protein
MQSPGCARRSAVLGSCAALLLSALALSGCGSSGSTSTRSPAPKATVRSAPPCTPGLPVCVSQSAGVKVTGPQRLDPNLEQALARNQPKLERPLVTCPSASSYPFTCRVAGQIRLHGKPIAATGTLKVIGIETSTHTYAYEVTYGPAGR